VWEGVKVSYIIYVNCTHISISDKKNVLKSSHVENVKVDKSGKYS
jgi:hypothetical protein